MEGETVPESEELSRWRSAGRGEEEGEAGGVKPRLLAGVGAGTLVADLLIDEALTDRGLYACLPASKFLKYLSTAIRRQPFLVILYAKYRI